MTAKRWLQPFNRGGCWIEVSNTAVYWQINQVFGKWPLKGQWPLNRGWTVQLIQLIHSFSHLNAYFKLTCLSVSGPPYVNVLYKTKRSMKTCKPQNDNFIQSVLHFRALEYHDSMLFKKKKFCSSQQSKVAHNFCGPAL